MNPGPRARRGGYNQEYVRVSKTAIVIIVVLLLTNAAAAWFAFGSPGWGADAVAPEAAEGASAENRLYLTLEPDFTVNFEGTRTLRYLQVSVSLMSMQQEVLDAVKRHMPAVRHQILLTLTEQKLDTMLTREAKLALGEVLLANLRELLQEVGEDDRLEALYFVSFVMQ